MKTAELTTALAIGSFLTVATLVAGFALSDIVAASGAKDPTPASERAPIRRGTATHDGMGDPWMPQRADGQHVKNPPYKGYPYGQ